MAKEKMEPDKTSVEIPIEAKIPELEEMHKRIDEMSDSQRKMEEELAYIRSKLAEVGATARAAAIASAVPIKDERVWQPLPIERYPKEWVEKHGVVDIAITPNYKQPSITINAFTIPVKPGVVFKVPGNVADALEELGLLGMPRGEE